MNLAHLIVTPRQHDVVEPAVWLVDSVLRGVNGVVEIRVAFKRIGVDVPVREVAADYESVL